MLIPKVNENVFFTVLTMIFAALAFVEPTNHALPLSTKVSIAACAPTAAVLPLLLLSVYILVDSFSHCRYAHIFDYIDC